VPSVFSIYHSFRRVTLWKWTVDICHNHVYRPYPLRAPVEATSTKLGTHLKIRKNKHDIFKKNAKFYLCSRKILLVPQFLSWKAATYATNIPEITPHKSTVFDFRFRVCLSSNIFQILTIFVEIHISSKMYIFNIWLLISPELHTLKEIRRSSFCKI
jgi:hypothetical protein